MLRLNSKPLTQQDLDHLAERQKEIDDLADFEARAKKANALWASKSASAFNRIKIVLKEMCVGVEICVYCEANEATDVEHIFPKKLYPEKAFTWENYVLACNKCNSHYKSDKFEIFTAPNSTDIQNVTPPRGEYRQPASDDGLFLNQRSEDPLLFLDLDLTNQLFVFTERPAEGTRDFHRATHTIKLLGLNARAALVAARKHAVRFYISRLENYANAKHSQDFQSLKSALNDDFDSIDDTADFIAEKERILASIKNDILEHSHPTVWRELVRQRANLPKTNGLLNAAPESVDWLS